MALRRAPDRCAALGPFSEKHGGRFHIDGQKVQLSAANSPLLTMALHELATNAAKYGALSNGSGRVHVTWAAPTDDKGRLNLAWQEMGGPLVKPPEREGFGSTLISRAFEHEEGGAHIQFDPQGVICTMRFAL